MIQWSPDTSPNRALGGGYDFTQPAIRGFSLTHLSGPGCGAYGDIPILPMTGGLPSGDPSDHTEPFTHQGEVGTAGYYSVTSGSPAITTELTATEHSAMARFTYPPTNNANVLLKLLDSQNGNRASSATIVGSNEVRGSTTSGFFCGSSGHYTLHFDIVFDQPFIASQVLAQPGQASPGAVFLTFDTTSTDRRTLQAKVAISFVDADNARGNWTAENPNPRWDFDEVRAQARSAWNKLLGRIEIEGGTASEQELFYTALYHSLLHPNVFSDTNGEYMGFDNTIHTVVSGGQRAQYANFSGWDIYHSQVQLSALVAPQEMSDAAQSMLNDASQNNGMLPKWSFANWETFVMVGDPADGILSGYYAFGARNFDTATALRLMLRQATVPNNIRPGLNYYQSVGYLPEDGTYGCCNFNGPVATTLEYAKADFALSQFASALGDASDARMLLRRSQNWQNIWNPRTNLFAPRLLDGTFVSGIGAERGMVEGSASQYRWIIPYNRRAQIAAMGGASVVTPLLDSFFTILDDPNGCGARLTNEFDHGVQYWNNFTGHPWRTQEVVNRVRTQLYRDSPAFIGDNDDLGALSSQLVWSMLGMYPDYPGSAMLTLNGPEFPREIIHLPSGASLSVQADDASVSNPYIQALAVNGMASTKLALDPSLLETGATLVFTMGASPNTSWGATSSDAPVSFSEGVSAIGMVTPDKVIVAPGQTASASLVLRSVREDVAQDVSWSARSENIGVDVPSGTLSVAAAAQAMQSLSFTAPMTEGRYTVAFPLASSTGTTPPSVAPLTVLVARTGSVWPFFDNIGISDDASMLIDGFDANGASFDHDGATYSKEALAAAGATPGATITVGGVSFKWLNGGPGGSLDNVTANGQTLAVPQSSVKTTLSLLGSASNASSAGAHGTLMVTYADSSKQAIPIAFTDWTRGGGVYPLAAGNTVALECAYRNSRGGSFPEFVKRRDDVATYIFALNVALTSTQRVASVTLPTDVSDGTMHLFDLQFH
jgi:predicted alpha-1,2-mannosidase